MATPAAMVHMGQDTASIQVRTVRVFEDGFNVALQYGKARVVVQSAIRSNAMIEHIELAAHLALCLGVPASAFVDAVQNFTGVQGRMRLLSLPYRPHILYDAYNANFMSFCSALQSLSAYEGPHYLVCGAMLGLGEHSDLPSPAIIGVHSND